MNRAFLLALLLFIAPPAQAQSVEPLSILISPQYPRPYETITVTPSSDLIDLSNSTITVTANGAVVEQGTGVTKTQVQMGGPGSRTTITIRAVNAGQAYTASMTIRPSDVSLIVEPQSTAHPFYKGASLLGAQGKVRLVAVPDLRTSAGGAIDPKNLVYTWRNGDQVLQSASGIGKSVLVATAPVRYRDATISVTVTSQDQSVVAQARTTLAPVDPLVRIYRSDPLLGPWFDTALPKAFSMTDSEETFRAVPYFFSSLPALTWQMNGNPSGTDREITVRSTGNGSGTAVIGITAKHTPAGQLANTSVSVKFGSEQSVGIFGL